MASSKLKILLYGYGNPGRQDDGLGVAVANFFENKKIPGLTIDSNYQLNAEDAVSLSINDVVIFVDASQNEHVEDIKFSELKPDNEVTFTTHAMSAGSVLALCEDVYSKKPAAYMLEVRGFEWEFKEELSIKGKENFHKACSFLEKILKDPRLDSFKKLI